VENTIKEPIAEQEETHKKDMRKIVVREDLYYIKFEMRARLLLSQTNKETFFNTFFEPYTDDEFITIKEVEKNLVRRPLRLSVNQSVLLARYLIEPRTEPIVEYNQYEEKEVKQVKNELEEFLGISYTFSANDFNKITQSTLLKIRCKKTQLVEQIQTDIVDVKKWREMFQDVAPELEHIEKDLFIAIGFEGTKDITKLSIKVLY